MTEMLDGFSEELARRAGGAAQEGELAARVSVEGSLGLLALSPDGVVVFLEQGDIRIPADLTTPGGVSFAFTANNTVTIRRGGQDRLVVRFADREVREEFRTKISAKPWATIASHSESASAAARGLSQSTSETTPASRARGTIGLLAGVGIAIQIIGFIIIDTSRETRYTIGSSGGVYAGTIIVWLGALLLFIAVIAVGVMLGTRAAQPD